MLEIMRGDTTQFECDLTDYNGDLPSGSMLTLTIRDYEDGNIIAQKKTSISAGQKYTFKLSKEEGKKLRGNYCVADMEISSDSTITTIWKADLRIVKDVTYD